MKARCSPRSAAVVLPAQDSLPHGAILGDSADLNFQRRVRHNNSDELRRISELGSGLALVDPKAERGEFVFSPGEACSTCTATPRPRPAAMLPGGSSKCKLPFLSTFDRLIFKDALDFRATIGLSVQDDHPRSPPDAKLLSPSL